MKVGDMNILGQRLGSLCRSLSITYLSLHVYLPAGATVTKGAH